MSKIKTQPDNYSCGIYSIINALLVYDDHRNREEIKELSKTTYRKGTDEIGIKNCLTELGYKSREYVTKNKNAAWRWVLKNSISYPLILCTEDNQHWAVVIGRIRNKVILVDYEDIKIIGKQELLLDWSYKGSFWGLKIG